MILENDAPRDRIVVRDSDYVIEVTRDASGTVRVRLTDKQEGGTVESVMGTGERHEVASGEDG